MIYHRKLLAIKIVFENTSKKKIFGVHRPSAYMRETGSFFTTMRMDILKNEIEPKDDKVLIVILESPAGFGEHLKPGALLIIRNGMDEEGRAVVLEILGYIDDLKE